jgi:hypothetical protein
MPIDRRHVGKRYGPFRYEVGRESILDFVAATDGGVPGRVFCGPGGSPTGRETGDPRSSTSPAPLIAPPAYAAVFAMQPFATACADPELAINVLRLVHGEQAFEFLEPVCAGDVLFTTGEITRIQDRGNLDFLEVSTESVNQHGRPVVRGVWTAIVRN